jgi:hypothetical protein
MTQERWARVSARPKEAHVCWVLTLRSCQLIQSALQAGRLLTGLQVACSDNSLTSSCTRGEKPNNFDNFSDESPCCARWTELVLAAATGRQGTAGGGWFPRSLGFVVGLTYDRVTDGSRKAEEESGPDAKQSKKTVPLALIKEP